MTKRIAATMVVSLMMMLGIAVVFSGETANSDTGWKVGELRENGLRIISSGQADASAVLTPGQFGNREVRHAYWIATQIPEVLNQLYCWCGCENRGVHRSNLQCFEDRMGTECAVCRGTAEIAYEFAQQGMTSAGTIQSAVDAQWQPKLRSTGDS